MSFSGSKFRLIEEPIWSFVTSLNDVISCSAVDDFLALRVFRHRERILRRISSTPALEGLAIECRQGTAADE